MSTSGGAHKKGQEQIPLFQNFTESHPDPCFASPPSLVAQSSFVILLIDINGRDRLPLNLDIFSSK